MNVLVTAGPTREALDPVRYLTNHSSGKMGYALAAAFAHAGHRVMLVSGPTQIDVPEGVDFLSVTTAADMFDAVAAHIDRMEIAIFAAAVADYAPARIAERKIKKDGETLVLELRRTRDVLGSARGAMGFRGTLVGFAAETESLEANARAKLQRKQCDLVIANDVSRRDIGFGSDQNEVLLVYPEHTDSLPAMPKAELAHELADSILDLHRASARHFSKADE